MGFRVQGSGWEERIGLQAWGLNLAELWVSPSPEVVKGQAGAFPGDRRVRPAVRGFPGLICGHAVGTESAWMHQ